MQRLTSAGIGFGLPALGIAWALATAPAAFAATIPVTSQEDRIANDGDCTLREAVISANEDRAVDACAKGGYVDTIELEAGTYRLTIPGPMENLAATGDLDLTDPVELVGAPGATQIVAPPGDRVLHVMGVHAKVTGLTLTGGDVTAQEPSSYFEEGRGGGVLLQSTPPDHSATLELVESTVSGNRANLGGGIGTALDRAMDPYLENIAGGAKPSAAAIVRSTISRNYSADEGGGFYAQFGGGTLRSSTVSGNVAGGEGGGLSSFLGGFRILNSTIARNRAAEGGGFTSSGPSAQLDLGISYIGGSIVADNEAEVGPDCSGAMRSVGANVLGATSGCELSARPTAVPDLLGVDPRLGPLANNGGPTETHAIGANSPANNLYELSQWSPFGQYPFTCEATDQRGEPRSADGRLPRCDAGAFEVVECMGVPATITGSEEDDRIAGTSAPDVIQATGGNDRIRSRGGDDLVCGNRGEDRIDTGRGEDRIQGGADDDTVRAGPGADYVRGLQPGGFAWRPPRNATIPGLTDVDTLLGGRGKDRLLGDLDDDYLIGGPGSDALVGGELADICVGGPGTDRMRKCEKREP
jgi:CSLREA domain-containing protein